MSDDEVEAVTTARVEAKMKRSREAIAARYDGKDGRRRLIERIRFLQSRAL